MENIVRKGEIACYKQFLLFSHKFSTLHGTYISFSMHFKMASAICFNLDQSKILSSGNELNPGSAVGILNYLYGKKNAYSWSGKKFLLINPLKVPPLPIKQVR